MRDRPCDHSDIPFDPRPVSGPSIDIAERGAADKSIDAGAYGSGNGELETDSHSDPNTSPVKPRFEYEAISMKELDSANYAMEWLINGILVHHQPAIFGGPQKTLKTNISIELMLSLSEGGNFLGEYKCARAVRVGLMSGESGEAVIQETARRIAKAKHRALADYGNAILCPAVPNLTDALKLQALERFINENELEVCIIDPTYLALPLGDGASNLFKVGECLAGISKIAATTGVLPILVHHLKSTRAEKYGVPLLEELAWAGFQEWCRQWLLVNRREAYDEEQPGSHKLWFKAGGSAGHSTMIGLDIFEGTSQQPGGRSWELGILKPGEIRLDKHEAKQRENNAKRDIRDNQDRSIVLKTAKRLKRETMTSIRDASGITPKRFGPIWCDLLAEQSVVQDGEIKKANGQCYSAFRVRDIRRSTSSRTGAELVEPMEQAAPVPVPPPLGGNGVCAVLPVSGSEESD